MAGMSDAALGVDDTQNTHASQSCSIAQYTAEKFYEYVAMIEMVYVLSTNDEARRQLLHEFSGSAFMLFNQSEMQDYFAEGSEDDARFYGRVGSIAEFFGYDEIAAENYELAKTYQERAAYQRDLADRLYAQAEQQFLDFFRDLWSTLKQRYHECGWFYAASTVAISGAFVLGGIVVGAGAAAAAIRALKFIPTRLQNGKIRVEVRNERLGTSYRREWSEEDLAAKYGKPDENHAGSSLNETNRSIPDEPADGMARRTKDANKTDEWADGSYRKPNDPDGMRRDADDTAMIQNRDGEWTRVDQIEPSSNAYKGQWGEAMADQRARADGWNKINGDDTPVGGTATHGRHGIDGIYENPKPPPAYFVTDAKTGGGGLGTTKNGKQLSPQWITHHLNDMVEKGVLTQDQMDDILLDHKPLVQRVDDKGNVTLEEIDGTVFRSTE